MFLKSKRRRFGGLLPFPATAARPQRAATGSHRRLFHLNVSHSSTSSCNNGSKSIKFLKKTLSFTDTSSMLSTKVVPKGFLVVCVGKEQKRFIIPTEYLGHQAFGVLLREVEEESDFSRRVCSRSHVKWLCLRGSWMWWKRREMCPSCMSLDWMRRRRWLVVVHPQIVSSHLLTILKWVGDQKMRRSDHIRFPQIVACPTQLVI